jgi:hypothetical protein
VEETHTGERLRGVPVYAGTGFGLIFHSELPLPSLERVAAPDHRSILVAIGDDAEVATGWDGTLARRIWTTEFADGCVVTIDRGLGDRARVESFEPRQDARAVQDGLEQEALPAGVLDDDILPLERADDCVVAHPGPPLVNMAGRGVCPSAGVGTWLTRFPEESEDWFMVDRHASSRRTPHTIFLVDHRPELEPGVERLRPTPLGPLAHSLSVGDRIVEVAG